MTRVFAWVEFVALVVTLIGTLAVAAMVTFAVTHGMFTGRDIGVPPFVLAGLGLALTAGSATEQARRLRRQTRRLFGATTFDAG